MADARIIVTERLPDGRRRHYIHVDLTDERDRAAPARKLADAGSDFSANPSTSLRLNSPYRVPTR